MPELRYIQTRSGAKFSVAAEHAAAFQGLLDDLEAAGYEIKGDQSGGFNPRNIAGTNIPSQHSFGRAIDINWKDNPRGGSGTIPVDVARELALKHGLTWGGDWSRPDNMHFEIRRNGPTPMKGRGLTSYAGLSAPVTTPTAVPASPQQTPSQGTPDMDMMSYLAGLFGGGKAQAATPPTQNFGSMAPAQVQKPVDEQNQLAAQAASMDLQGAQLPGGRRMPIDLSRLRQVIAQRAQLGTGVS